jgi:hypothetical protein
MARHLDDRRGLLNFHRFMLSNVGITNSPKATEVLTPSPQRKERSPTIPRVYAPESSATEGIIRLKYLALYIYLKFYLSMENCLNYTNASRVLPGDRLLQN